MQFQKLNLVPVVIILFTSVTVFSVSSCKSTKPTATASTCTGSTLVFITDIKPIIDANCASSCHSAEKHMHHLDLTSYGNVKDIAAKPEFLGSLKHEAQYTPMPKNKPQLDDASIQKINCWIKNGMPE